MTTLPGRPNKWIARLLLVRGALADVVRRASGGTWSGAGPAAVQTWPNCSPDRDAQPEGLAGAGAGAGHRGTGTRSDTANRAGRMPRRVLRVTPGLPLRGLLTALLALPLLGLPSLAGTASAGSQWLVDPTGDSASPATDIITYGGNMTGGPHDGELRSTSVLVGVGMAGRITHPFTALRILIDTNRDGSADYVASDSVLRPTSPARGYCGAQTDARTARTYTMIDLSFPAHCLGFPDSIRIRAVVGADAAPSPCSWSPEIRIAFVPGGGVPDAAPRRLAVAVTPAAIVAGHTPRVWVGGLPCERVDLYARTSPATSFRLVRSGTTNSAGLASWLIRPGAQTELYAMTPHKARRSATATLLVRR